MRERPRGMGVRKLPQKTQMPFICFICQLLFPCSPLIISELEDRRQEAAVFAAFIPVFVAFAPRGVIVICRATSQVTFKHVNQKKGTNKLL